MNSLQNILERLFCNNSALESELIIANQESKDLRERLKECKDKNLYYKIAFVVVSLWALLATLAAIEVVIHS